MKNFIEVNGSKHLNMIFNELFENAEQMKLKNKKNKEILEISLNLKKHFHSLLVFYKIILHLNFCDPFLAKNSKTLYSGHLVIQMLFLGTVSVCYRQAWLYNRALNMSGLHRILNIPVYAWIFPERAWIGWNMRECAWICLYAFLPEL